jgi:putative cell wall-binding protein
MDPASRTQLRRTSSRLALACALVLVAAALTAPSSALAAGPVPAENIGGLNRYETAALVSHAAYPRGARTVLLAGGDAWPDALGGSALAGTLGAPILLSPPKLLAPSAVIELARLKPARVILLGGPVTLSDGVATQVRALLPAATVERVGGPDRIAVAESVAALVSSEASSAPKTAFVVTGATFADALSCSSPAAANGWPVLLADSRNPARVASAAMALRIRDVVIVGGTRSVTQATQAALADALGAGHVTRIEGPDRYATSAAVARFATSRAGGLSFASPVFASGAVAVDGLSAGPLAALRGGPLLLANSAGVPEPIAGELFANRSAVSGLTFVGGIVTLPPWTRAEAQHALRAPAFSAGNALEHVRRLSAMGVRLGGTAAENAAADYIAARLREYGYTVTVQPVPIPGGRISHNVIAEKPGSAPGVIVIGAHMDSEPPSPGANDNASGVGVTLELARCMASAEGLVPSVRFIAFGSEEVDNKAPGTSHFGSDTYVRLLSPAEKAKIEAAVSIDMVGFGDRFYIRHMQWAPMNTVNSLRGWSLRSGQPMQYVKDGGKFGWSDYEAFEFAGIPSAWLEWYEDTAWHTTRDTFSRVSSDRLGRTGRVVRGWLLDLDAARLAALRP